MYLVIVLMKKYYSIGLFPYQVCILTELLFLHHFSILLQS